MIKLEQHASGVVLPVRAKPGSSRDEIRGVREGALNVAVTQAPEKGKANKAIIALLAKQLDLRKSQITLLSGDTSSQKRFLVEGLELAELEKRIGQLIQPES